MLNHRSPGAGLPDRGNGFFAWLAHVRRQELAAVIGMLLVFAGIWAFAEIADEVLEGEIQGLDETILLAMRMPGDLSDPIGPHWLEEIGRDLTALGGVAVITLLILCAVIYLILEKRYRIALFALLSVAGGLLVSTLLKNLFDRPRPDLISHDSLVYTASFPSGHSMMAAVVYLTLAVLLMQAQRRWRTKSFLLTAALLLTALVGVSRVYLGVHWPTDVLAGWTAGAAWAALCWLAARWLQRRGAVEPAAPQEDEPAP